MNGPSSPTVGAAPAGAALPPSSGAAGRTGGVALSATPPPVLVVGAGPVGLAAAAWLAEFGVPVRIIDSSPAPSTHSKAFAVWRRTLAALAPLVPLAEWTAAPGAGGIHRLCMLNAGRLIASVSVPDVSCAGHALPAGMILSQAETERLLAAALAARGVEVERGVELRSLAEDASGVDVALARVAGGADRGAGVGAPEERARFSYVVGADGAHSAVRHALGVRFEGVTLLRRFWMADVKCEPAGAPGAAGGGAPEAEDALGTMMLYTTAQGMLIVMQFSDGLYRVLVDGGEVAADAPRVEPQLALFESALREHTRLALRPTSAVWLTEFRVNERVASSYQSGGGRVLLAGDAAHVHSPAGGQGMNLGLMDATNLAWKLALAHAGAAGPQLLSSYGAERRPAARAVVRASGALLRTAMVRNRLLRRLRAALLGAVLRSPRAQRAFVSTTAGDKLAYKGSPLAGAAAARGARAAPGCMLPDVPVVVAGERRAATDLAHAKGCMGALVLGPDAKREEWPGNMGGRRLAVWQVGAELEDGEGTAALVEALGIARDGGALVRPDGAVAASGGRGAVRAWLEQHVAAAAGV